MAVVGSNTMLEVNGKRVRGRIYPWGVVEGITLAVTMIVYIAIFHYLQLRTKIIVTLCC